MHTACTNIFCVKTDNLTNGKKIAKLPYGTIGKFDIQNLPAHHCYCDEMLDASEILIIWLEDLDECGAFFLFSSVFFS